MMRFFSDVRLVPVVLVAAVALFVLKFTGLVTEGSYTLGAGHLSKADRVAHEAQLAQDLAKSAASRLQRRALRPRILQPASRRLPKH